MISEEEINGLKQDIVFLKSEVNAMKHAITLLHNTINSVKKTKEPEKKVEIKKEPPKKTKLGPSSLDKWNENLLTGLKKLNKRNSKDNGN